MRKEQYCFFSNQKKKPRYLGNNKPKVDWVRILWKCHEHFKWPSQAEAFVHGQELDFAVAELHELRKRQATGQLGHKSERRNVIHYSLPHPELNCDDPLYDGEPIF